jgi:hypothetical protein
MKKQVYYIIAVDDDLKPIHTTRMCGSEADARDLKNSMAQDYHDVMVFRELEKER